MAHRASGEYVLCLVLMVTAGKALAHIRENLCLRWDELALRIGSRTKLDPPKYRRMSFIDPGVVQEEHVLSRLSSAPCYYNTRSIRALCSCYRGKIYPGTDVCGRSMHESQERAAFAVELRQAERSFAMTPMVPPSAVSSVTRRMGMMWRCYASRSVGLCHRRVGGQAQWGRGGEKTWVFFFSICTEVRAPLHAHPQVGLALMSASQSSRSSPSQLELSSRG